jgi:hypothetical protein
VPDHAIHASDVRQQPQAETGYVEQIPHSQRDHLQVTNPFSRTITVPFSESYKTAGPRLAVIDSIGAYHVPGTG